MDAQELPLKLRNKSEITAYNWIRRKYPQEEIVYYPSNSPDFILSNGQAYEVKRGYPDRENRIHILMSSRTQLGKIVRDYPQTSILVVVGDAVSEFPILKIIKEEVENIVVHSPKMVKISITIFKDQKDWLEKNHIELSGLVQEMLEKRMKNVKYL